MALVDPSADGRFGEFGGRFVPETLIPALDELEAEDRTSHARRLIDDLPLFSHRPASVDRTDPLRQALKAIEPDALHVVA